MTTRRRVMRLFALSGFTVALTLLLLEALVRLIPLYPDTFALPDPTRGWRYQPGMTGVWVNASCLGQIRNTVTLNSHALHDVEQSYAKPAGARRILVIGDSVVAAFEVPVEQMFTRLLEARLNAAGDALYNVVAAGHQGYGTDLEWLYYEQEGRRYQADVVLLVMQPHNDFRDNHPGLRDNAPPGTPYFTLAADGGLTLHQPPAGQDALLGSVSRLYRLIQARLSLIQPRAQPDEAAYRRMIDESWAVTFALVERFRAAVEADGAQFGVVIEQSYINPPQARAEIHRAIAERLDALGVRYLSLLDAFDAAGGETRYACDTHWTAAGHALAAETLLPFAQSFFAA